MSEGEDRTPQIREKRVERLLFLTVILACSWFFSAGSCNQNSRYDAIFAFCENEPGAPRTFCIDRFVPYPEQKFNTGDWSLYEGHYYSNKSPGTTLLGILAYMPIRSLELAVLVPHTEFSPELDIFNAWLLNVLLSGLPLAFGAVAFRKILRRFELSPERATLFTFLMVFGTGMWPYATQLWALPATGAFLILSLYFFLKGTPRTVCAAGLFYGLAVLFDYSAAVMIPVAGIALLVSCRMRGRRLLPLFFLLGGLPMALLYFRYNTLCFGGPLRFAFMYNNPIFVDEGRTGGVAALPGIRILLELLIGQYRGLFPSMPFLIFAIPGFLLLWKAGDARRRLALLSGGIILSLLLMNASFNGWHGGYAILPRYLIPSFPAWCLLAAFAPLKRPGIRGVFVLTALLSFFNMASVTLCTPVGWGEEPSPVYRMAYGTWKDRELVFRQGPLKLHYLHRERDRITRQSSSSFGELAGLPRNVSGGCLTLLLAGLGTLFLLTPRTRRFLRKEYRYWRQLLLRKNAIHLDSRGLLLILGLLLLFLLPGNASFLGDGARSVLTAWYTKEAGMQSILPLASSAGCGPLGILVYRLFLMMIPHDLALFLLLKAAVTVLPVFVVFRLIFRRSEEIDGREPLLFLLFAPLFYLSVRSFSAATLLIPVSACIFRSFHRLARSDSRRDALLTVGWIWTGVLIHPEAGLTFALAFTWWLPVSGLLRKRYASLFLCTCLSLLPVAVRLLPLWKRGMFPGWGRWALCTAPIRALSWMDVMKETLPDAPALFSPALLNFWKIAGLVTLCGTLLYLLAGAGYLIRRRAGRRTDPVLSLGFFALISILAFFPVMPMMNTTDIMTAALPLFLPAALLAALGAAELRRFGKTPDRLALFFFGFMAVCLCCFIVLLERSGGSPHADGYGPTLKNQLSVFRDIQKASLHAKYIDLEVQTDCLTADPMHCKFLSDFLMKTDPPIREEAVKTMEGLPVRIVYTGPTGTGFIRAETWEEGRP